MVLATNGTVRDARGLTSRTIDLAVLDGVLNVHETADLQRKRKSRRLPFQLAMRSADREKGGSEQALSPE